MMYFPRFCLGFVLSWIWNGFTFPSSIFVYAVDNFWCLSKGCPWWRTNGQWFCIIFGYNASLAMRVFLPFHILPKFWSRSCLDENTIWCYCWSHVLSFLFRVFEPGYVVGMFSACPWNGILAAVGFSRIASSAWSVSGPFYDCFLTHDMSSLSFRARLGACMSYDPSNSYACHTVTA